MARSVADAFSPARSGRLIRTEASSDHQAKHATYFLIREKGNVLPMQISCLEMIQSPSPLRKTITDREVYERETGGWGGGGGSRERETDRQRQIQRQRQRQRDRETETDRD